MRLKRRNPSTKLRRIVISRDGGCVAPKLDPGAGPCRRTVDGEIVSARDDRYLELDHVREEPGGQLPTDAAHLVAACQYHHRGGWSTSNRAPIRTYLATLYPVEWAEWAARRT